MQGSSKLRQRNKAGIDKEGVELGKEAEEAEKRDTIYGRTPDGRGKGLARLRNMQSCS